VGSIAVLRRRTAEDVALHHGVLKEYIL
jgi:hypothetical protein